MFTFVSLQKRRNSKITLDFNLHSSSSFCRMSQTTNKENSPEAEFFMLTSWKIPEIKTCRKSFAEQQQQKEKALNALGGRGQGMKLFFSTLKQLRNEKTFSELRNKERRNFLANFHSSTKVWTFSFGFVCERSSCFLFPNFSLNANFSMKFYFNKQIFILNFYSLSSLKMMHLIMDGMMNYVCAQTNYGKMLGVSAVFWGRNLQSMSSGCQTFEFAAFSSFIKSVGININLSLIWETFDGVDSLNIGIVPKKAMLACSARFVRKVLKQQMLVWY